MIKGTLIFNLPIFCKSITLERTIKKGTYSGNNVLQTEMNDVISRRLKAKQI